MEKKEFIDKMMEIGAGLELSCSTQEEEAYQKVASALYDMHFNKEKSPFEVGSYTILTDENKGYCHWSKGLKMVLSKDGVTIKIQEEEIEKLVKSLPRTLGGSY